MSSQADPEDRAGSDCWQKILLTCWLQVREWWLQVKQVFARRNSFCGFARQLALVMIRLNESRETLPISEVVTGAGRLSPFEDFKRRTLSAIEGLWSKLLYVAELRSQDGRYEHWGHGRVHGKENSQMALAKIHSELYLEVLRTPLKDLVLKSGDDASIASFPTRLPNSVVPADLLGGSPRHLNSIALAVRLLDAHREASTRSNA